MSALVPAPVSLLDHRQSAAAVPWVPLYPVRPARPTVVHILSTNYAGSHYLSLMLGSHSRAQHLGEVHRLRRGLHRPIGAVCFACRQRGFCPIFSDIAPAQLDQIYRIILARVDRRVTTLIDTSKLARGWLNRFFSDDVHEHKYIHLLRDPRALVRRWSLPQPGWRKDLGRRWRMAWAFPRRSARLAVAPRTEILTYQWLQQNRRITQLIERHRLDAQVVTYHDLALDPAHELSRLMPWIGLPFEPAQREYWKFEHHGTQKATYEWIKDARFAHFDVRWQKDLPEPVQQQIIGNRDVQAYLDYLGLSSDADGLTHGLIE